MIHKEQNAKSKTVNSFHERIRSEIPYFQFIEIMMQ